MTTIALIIALMILSSVVSILFVTFTNFKAVKKYYKAERR
jgi:Tfp pilus assembly protein PilW